MTSATETKFNVEIPDEYKLTRGERRIADELRKSFGDFKRVVIDVDGEQHEFSADSLIQMLEDYEDAQGMSNHMKLFGTPERAARTLTAANDVCKTTQPCYPNCPLSAAPWCPSKSGSGDYDELLEWLREEGETE